MLIRVTDCLLRQTSAPAYAWQIGTEDYVNIVSFYSVLLHAHSTLFGTMCLLVTEVAYLTSMFCELDVDCSGRLQSPRRRIANPM